MIFFILKKLPYYFISLVDIIFQIQNPLSLFWGILRRKVCLIKFKNGLLFYVIEPIDLLILKETILDDAYELKKLPKGSSCIIDVGAGVGDFCITAAKMYPQSVIYAFEPNYKEYEKLLKNIQLNQINNIKSYNVAIGSKSKYTFYISKFGVRSSIIKDRFSEEKVEVKGKRIDAYITRSIDLLKIDCEGAELDVLSTLTLSQAKKVHKIILEYHNHLIPNISQMVIDKLRKLGFTTRIVPDPYNDPSNYDIGYVYGLK